jgi:hypothetical protein
MFRKTLLAIAAAGVLGTAAFVSTPASAHGSRHGGWHGGSHGGSHGGWHGGWNRPHHQSWGPRFFHRPAYAGFYNPCLRRTVVLTPWGPRTRLVNICAY